MIISVLGEEMQIKSPFLAKMHPNLAIWTEERACKIFFIKFFENYFFLKNRQKKLFWVNKSTFFPFDLPHDLPLPTHFENFEMHKMEVFRIFLKKKLKIHTFYHFS